MEHLEQKQRELLSSFGVYAFSQNEHLDNLKVFLASFKNLDCRFGFPKHVANNQGSDYSNLIWKSRISFDG